MTEPPSLSTLPLFPLGTVLFPGGLLPLRIFEVRYLDLIGRCQRDGTPFGVVLLTSGSEVRQPGQTETFHEVGTLAMIEALSEPQPGMMTLRCRGTQRFRIHSGAQQKNGLWVAEADFLPPDPWVAVPEHLRYTSTALEKLRRTLQEEGQDLLSGTVEPLWDDSGWVANRWAELLPVPNSVKQSLMALDHPLLRLELVGDLLLQHGVVRVPGDPA